MSPLSFDRPGVHEYVEAHTSAPAAHLRELAEATHRELALPQMLTGAVEGRLLEFLAWLRQPRLVLEIGTFSGYSAQAMAAALPQGGRIVSLEVSDEHADFAQRHIDAGPHADRIEIRRGPAGEAIEHLDGPFDLVFIDADKTGYLGYYEAVLPKLAPDGLIVVDNTLWSGDVLDPGDDETTRALAGFNDRVASDERVVSVMLTVRDGVTLIRRRPSDNVEIVRRAYEAFAQRDDSAVFELYSPDIEWDGTRWSGGMLGVADGHAGVRDSFRELLSTFRDLTFEAEELVPAGDSVVATVHERGVGRGSGAAVDRHHYAVWTLRDRQVVRLTVFMDRAEALAAAGLPGSPDPSH